MNFFVIVLAAILPTGEMAVAVMGDDNPVVFKTKEACEKVRAIELETWRKSMPPEAVWELNCLPKAQWDKMINSGKGTQS